MSTQEEWGGQWSTRIGEAIRRERQRRGWSAQKLSDRCLELGVNVTRSVITDMENRPRQAVPVQALAAIAAALEVEPALLLYPLHDGATPVPVTPGRERLPIDAIRWWVGTDDTRPVGLAMTERVQHALAVTRHEQFINAVNDALDSDDSPGDSWTRPDDPHGEVEQAQAALSRALEKLRSTREEMARHGMTPPPIDDTIRDDYDQSPDDR